MKQRGRPPKSQSFMERLKSRKLLISLLCLTVGAVIDLYSERGLSQNLLTLMMAIIGIYTTGNVAAKRAAQTPKSNNVSSGNNEELKKEVENVKNAQVQYEDYLNKVVEQVKLIQNEVSTVNENMNQIKGSS